VEDEIKSARLFEVFLSKPNIYNVKFRLNLAKRMDEAISKLNDNNFDIILLDLHLPDSKGFDTFDTLIQKYNNIPIVILTNIQNDELILLCLKEGAQDYIFKSEANSYMLQQSIIHSIERYRLLKELKESKNNLSNFIHTVAHDLKNPLQSILTLSGMIKYYYKNDSSVNLSSYVERLENRMENITNMIDNLLMYSIADKEVITIDNVDLNECVKYVEDNLSTLISETNTRIIFDDLPTVKTDKGQIIQLLQNLIENSIKYKSELAPEIEIKHKIGKNDCQIIVKDNGIGIPKDKQDQVFNLFNQAHNEIKKEGFGIGLSICKKIIERYNGEIWLESEEGKGTAFIFTLPCVDDKIN